MEEIPSDSEDIESDEQNDEVEEEEYDETAQEKRYRLAKEYLAELERQEAEKSENKQIDAEAIAEKLRDHSEQIRRVQRRIADSVSFF
ncbi:unnamed protein product [Soboliphyme baturini]|uniref:Nucleotide exchange factor GrpE n=1 Tax=Soboliphyme baturini TaxID=241478 RepID=A0A183J701_9BILA|nr:unnamed protein product [Soboliphyme baturini]